MLNTKTELPQSVLQIKQDDKFFRRLLSKESSMSNPSFRVALAIPFVWESQPGTPKYSFSEDTLPPLTPPPSYHLNINAYKKPEKKRSKSNLLLTLIPKLNLKKMIMSSSSYPSWSSPSGSSKVVPMAKFGKKKFLSYGSSTDIRGGDNEENVAASPSSKLCFSTTRANSSKISQERNMSHTCYRTTWKFLELDSANLSADKLPGTSSCPKFRVQTDHILST
ncbi:uncharacterized protein LOC113850969 [Abrus precatorius]|uniref:Uncharacterized protein LOC113850969 n=1 Tax=Abrus precatorius TaxID=3816 RepID=A0A8B8K0V3_ABRPR|nr:uncharacterized protein LOC113850969 [Abrus precatorius]